MFGIVITICFCVVACILIANNIICKRLAKKEKEEVLTHLLSAVDLPGFCYKRILEDKFEAMDRYKPEEYPKDKFISWCCKETVYRITTKEVDTFYVLYELNWYAEVSFISIWRESTGGIYRATELESFHFRKLIQKKEEAFKATEKAMAETKNRMASALDTSKCQ